MHKFLRTVGFSEYQKKRKIESLIKELAERKTETKLIQMDEETNLCEVRSELLPGIGVALIGEMDENDEFHPEYYYPYILGTHITSQAHCSIHRHAEKESYSGLLEEYKVGVSLIFYLINFMEYLEKKAKSKGRARSKKLPVVSSAMLTGLSVSGKILLPVGKTDTQIESAKVAARNRSTMIEAAKNGDEEAMENLTIEDIDLYAKISRRILKEDVYSIVESSFVPCGVECDQYSIVGEISEMQMLKNPMTQEEICFMAVNCNDLMFQILINKLDLIGEPAVGRRFKGKIWMQGTVNFQ